MLAKGKSSGIEDLETRFGGTAALDPVITAEDSRLRWAFIKKVYRILSTQMLLTMVVASIVVFSMVVKEFFASSPTLLTVVITTMLLILMWPLYYYRQSHPINLVLLGLFTVGVSLGVGISCAYTNGLIVLEALHLTAAIFLSLTAYTYWASRNGYDFDFLGPILFVCVIIFMVLLAFIQAFFPLGPVSTAFYGSLVFSVYIVYNTDNLIKQYTNDEYIWASYGSPALYFDIINLFLSILQFLRSIQGGDN